jgi:bacterial/archaeal transporter family-2 protein
MTRLAVALAVAAGIAAAFQAAANAGLSARIGLGAALVVNTSIVLAGTILLYVMLGPRGGFFPGGVPWTLYVGGLCGFVLLASLAFVFPKIGAAVAIALVVLGQGVAALAIDHYGLLGMPAEPVTLGRVAGLVLVGAGVVLLRK